MENAAMKTEELNPIREDIETVNRKLRELTDEELEQMTGGGMKIGVEIRCRLFEGDTTCKKPWIKGSKKQCEGCRLNV